MTDPKTEALAIWLAQQQQQSYLAQQQTQPGELHLHQHNHAAPAPAPEQRQTMKMHPLFAATYLLFISVALALPLALIAAIVEAGNQPEIIYQQPSRGGW